MSGVSALSTRWAVLLLAACVCLPAPAADPLPIGDGEECVACHASKTSGFSPAHAFGGARCALCHKGNPRTRDQADAHAGLIAFPGNPENAREICGPCHAQQVDAVQNGFMHTGKGIVQLTRRVLGEDPGEHRSATLGGLGSSPADSLLRKLCAGCHLGQAKKTRHLDSSRRGGGCLACHIESYPPNGHPMLTVDIDDARCFGCHSRSARAALNYRGLAEVEEREWQLPNASALSRLQDGRLVRKKAQDVHHAAGMGCTDCHTGPGLMASAVGLEHARDAVDIECNDCHHNRGRRVRLRDWPERHAWYRSRIPFPADDTQPFLVTRRGGTPLWHIELRGDDLFLHTKTTGRALRIPPYRDDSHEPASAHARLTCSACHSQWAPQCYGCHVQFVPNGRQWDHQSGKVTPGRWRESRWSVRNDLPPLGVRYDGQIAPFVPGMIMTVETGNSDEPLFRRLFASIEPHTSGRARTCAECHESSVALGLGRGTLASDGEHWRFVAEEAPLIDGLPSDAWTDLTGTVSGQALREGGRPLNPTEMRRILDATRDKEPQNLN